MWQTMVQQGIEAFHKQDFAAAEEHFRAAVEAVEAAGIPVHEAPEPHTHLNASYKAQRKFAQALDGLGRLLDIYKTQYGPDDPKVGTVLHELAQVSGLMGRPAEAEFALLDALRIVKNQQDPLKSAEYLTTVSAFYAAHHVHDRCLERLQEALELRRAHQGPDHDQIAELWIGLAACLDNLGRHEEADQARGNARDMVARLYGPQHEHVGSVEAARGGAYRIQRNWPKAIQHFEASLAIRRQALGEHVEVFKTLQELAYAATMANLLELAEKAQSEALQLGPKVLPAGDPQLALALGGMARIRQLQGRLEEAESLFHESIAQLQESLGPTHFLLFQTIDSLLECMVQGKNYQAAMDLATEQMKLRSSQLGADHFSVAEALNKIGLVLLHQKEYLKAASVFEQALQIWDRYPGIPDYQRILCYYNMGAACHGKVDYFRAEDFYRKALDELERHFGANHPTIPHVLSNLSTLLRQTGRENQSRQMLEKAQKMAGAAQ